MTYFIIFHFVSKWLFIVLLFIIIYLITFSHLDQKPLKKRLDLDVKSLLVIVYFEYQNQSTTKNPEPKNPQQQDFFYLLSYDHLSFVVLSFVYIITLFKKCLNFELKCVRDSYILNIEIIQQSQTQNKKQQQRQRHWELGPGRGFGGAPGWRRPRRTADWSGHWQEPRGECPRQKGCHI